MFSVRAALSAKRRKHLLNSLLCGYEVKNFPRHVVKIRPFRDIPISLSLTIIRKSKGGLESHPSAWISLDSDRDCNGAWSSSVTVQACACGLAIAVYFGIVIYSSQRDGMKGIDPYYFFASTVTTVGFGDLHPQSREARMLAIRKYKKTQRLTSRDYSLIINFFHMTTRLIISFPLLYSALFCLRWLVSLPFGLIVIGFGLALVQAFLADYAQKTSLAYRNSLTLLWMEFDVVSFKDRNI